MNDDKDNTPEADFELEDRLRVVMRRHDHEAPGRDELDLRAAGNSAGLASDRRRRRAIVASAAAAAIVAAALVSAAVAGHDRHNGQAAGPTTSASPTHSPTGRSAAPPSSAPAITPTGTPYTDPPRKYGPGYTPGNISLGTEFTTVQYRGLSLSYPQSGDGGCEDTTGVYYAGPTDNSWFDDCVTADDPKNPILVFAALDGSHPLDSSPATQHTTIDGVPALVGRRGDYDYIVVPSLQVVARFDSGSADQTQRSFASAAIVTKDPRGCPLRADPNKDPSTTIPGASSEMVPGHPVSTVVCDYRGAELLSFPPGSTDPRNTPARQQSGLNALTRTSTSCRPLTDRDSHLFVTYADGSVLDVRVRRARCSSDPTEQGPDVIYTNGPLTRIGDEDTIIQPI